MADSAAPRRVVVTGGAGFLGSWTCETLLARGSEVVCVDNFATGTAENLGDVADHPGLVLLEQDVSTGLDVDGDIDWVLHLASIASPVHYQRLPIETMLVGSHGTQHALELARRKQARFVLASTSEVYGDPQQHPQPETYWGNVNPVGPRSVYDESKRFAEALTCAFQEARGVNAGIVRIFNTYGPRMQPDDGRAVPVFIGQALAGEPVTVAGDGSQTRSLCYVEDTVQGILAMAASHEAGPVNIGNPEELTVLGLARCVLDLAGSASEIVFVDLPTDDPRLRRPDTSRAENLLGWRPRVSVEEGLRRTLAWFSRAPDRTRSLSGA